jgi:hypothetical protein
VLQDKHKSGKSKNDAGEISITRENDLPPTRLLSFAFVFCLDYDAIFTK